MLSHLPTVVLWGLVIVLKMLWEGSSVMEWRLAEFLFAAALHLQLEILLVTSQPTVFLKLAVINAQHTLVYDEVLSKFICTDWRS